MDNNELINKIKELKEKKNAVIVAHNYQRPEIQDIADFTGDSLELSRKCAAAKENMIVFCGVKFMAETAKILSPQKKVLLPKIDAGCQLADSITPAEVDEYRKNYPDAVIVGYVNTTAEVKAKLDYCVTSANAVDIVKKINSKKIVFLPDKNLGLWVKKNIPEKEIIIHNGRCYVHHKFLKEDVLNARKFHPDAVILAHPECSPEVLTLSDVIASTSGMIKYVKESSAKKFILATEEGIIHRLQKERPDAEFYSLGNAQICFNMKLIKLIDVYNSLEKEVVEINLSDEIIHKAKLPIDRMVAL
ncbi:MAG: quinolinate synthase NadA [Candidatus Goldbacteria bacterium]|nr:quinolinate synthase NadA [Candidatus Goldiibacteriota bacterium]